jgi:cation diffusion facilitator CzcD-associated flavoprotein CzcO
VPVIFRHTITLLVLNQIRPGLLFTPSMYWLIEVSCCTVCLLITSAPEIEKYLLEFQGKYGLADSIRLNSRVISAIWHEERGEYDVEVETPEGISRDTCHVLINATGVLNKWKCRTPTPPLLQSLTRFSGPKIPGLHTFKGPLLHSAHWDQSVQYKSKRVAVLGTGSSAIQVQDISSKMYYGSN